MKTVARALEHSALLSPDSAFRFVLRRRWREGPTLPVVLLNPSVAGAEHDDATVRWLRGYTERHGFGALVLSNVFPFVETSLTAASIAGQPGVPVNPYAWGDYLTGLFEVFSEAKRGLGWVLCGWGDGVAKLPSPAWVNCVLEARRAYQVELRALGTTARGNPWHPLRKSHALEPVKWEPTRSEP